MPKKSKYFQDVEQFRQDMLVKAELCEQPMQFSTTWGLFSPRAIDDGSRLMLDHIKVNRDDNCLDIGCGYGPVGVILSKLYPKTEITMCDINERAIELASMNLKRNNVKARVIKSNLYEGVNEKFDIILSNPPQHAGKKTCFEIIVKAPNFLKKNGTLQVVARHQKGGKTLAKKMEEVFGNVETIGRKSGYQVYLSRK